MDQVHGPITTAISKEEGRLKVGAGSFHKKKKAIVKSVVHKCKKDGKGGAGNAPNSPLEKSGVSETMQSSLTPSNSYVPIANSAPTLSQSDKTTGYRMARSLKLKRMNKLQTSLSGLNKKDERSLKIISKKDMQIKSKSSKKALLKKIIKGKKKGKSPIKMDGGLGSSPLSGGNITGGSGSNLGTNGVF